VWIRADGGGEPQPLTKSDARVPFLPFAISPDGRRVIFGRPGSPTEFTGNLLQITLDASDPDHPKAGEPEPLSRSAIWGAAISPDGRWLAYASNDSGQRQVFVQPFADGKIGQGRYQISA